MLLAMEYTVLLIRVLHHGYHSAFKADIVVYLCPWACSPKPKMKRSISTFLKTFTHKIVRNLNFVKYSLYMLKYSYIAFWSTSERPEASFFY